MQTAKEIQFSLTIVGEQNETERLSSLIQSELLRISKFPGVTYSEMNVDHAPKGKFIDACNTGDDCTGRSLPYAQVNKYPDHIEPDVNDYEVRGLRDRP